MQIAVLRYMAPQGTEKQFIRGGGCAITVDTASVCGFLVCYVQLGIMETYRTCRHKAKM